MGEKQGTRDRIDSMVQQMRQAGASEKYAREKAINAAKKSDRKNNN
jgi:hypothetical protein